MEVNERAVDGRVLPCEEREEL
jgi:hypothetical protein